MEIRIERVQGRPVAVVRRRALQAELSRVVPEACGVVWSGLKGAGVKGAGRHVAVYLDHVMNIEVGVEIDGVFTGVGEVVRSELPAGEVATLTHWGPYQGLGKTHDALQKWCAQEGRALAGVCWELYGHWEKEWEKEPAKIRTDVYYLLK